MFIYSVILVGAVEIDSCRCVHVCYDLSTILFVNLRIYESMCVVVVFCARFEGACTCLQNN